ncbi:hypothetical protein Dimus_014630, partial [Dionaea muscipula]
RAGSRSRNKTDLGWLGDHNIVTDLESSSVAWTDLADCLKAEQLQRPTIEEVVRSCDQGIEVKTGHNGRS